MKIIKYLHPWLSLVTSCIIALMLLGSCSQRLDNTTTDSIPVIQSHSRETHGVSTSLNNHRASLHVFVINHDSLTRITPGENGIPLPEKIPAGIPKIVPTNTNIHPALAPKIIPAGAPDIINVSHFGNAKHLNPATGDTLQPPKTVPAIDTSAPLSVRRAG
ncbi:MAG: hypothetical protein HY738_13930, partial [Bacteroidia bacterium]|nr:hypothetical protein [Bacteroidia bacterium]